eukprot:c22940_g1_i1 orf=86-667(+)
MARTGINYTRILDNLLVGSQLRCQDDIDHLFYGEGVTAILNLQQDRDVQYTEIDFSSIARRCEALGILYIRRAVRDFDPISIRRELPKAVSSLERVLSDGKTAYVHCTAGFGRSPTVVVAYLFWFTQMDIDAAYNLVISKRCCEPDKEAIQGATYDLVNNNSSFFEQDNALRNVASHESQFIQDSIRSLQRHQ